MRLKGMNTRRDVFKLSIGNIRVLETIPKMMQDYKWRKKLRLLVLDYIFQTEIKRGAL